VSVVILRGDAAALPLPDASVDAVVCDPPYGLAELPAGVVAEVVAAWISGDRLARPLQRGFMGRAWDGFVPPPGEWDEAFRVLKPGGHLLAFAGARTQDLMGLSIRLAGFEIRDGLAWLFAGGFPKSLSVSRAIDKAKRRDYVLAAIELGLEVPGNSLHDWTKAEHSPGDAWWERFKAHLAPEDWQRLERAVTGRRASGVTAGMQGLGPSGIRGGTYDVTAPATEDAAEWEGWGTALRPSHEPVILARKPFAGTVARNVREFGTGALNIDGCRVESAGRPLRVSNRTDGNEVYGSGLHGSLAAGSTDAGRWPPNVLLSEEAAAELDRQSGVLTSGKLLPGHADNGKAAGTPGAFAGTSGREPYGDSGGASRFFPVFRYQAKAGQGERPRLPDGTAWPTVKPVPLIRWLLRLVTPPGGTVLDMFCGTGTTGEAALIEGFNAVLIDKDPQAIALTSVRLAKPVQPLMFGIAEYAGPARAAGVPKPPPVPEGQGSLFDGLEAS